MGLLKKRQLEMISFSTQILYRTQCVSDSYTRHISKLSGILSEILYLDTSLNTRGVNKARLKSIKPVLCGVTCISMPIPPHAAIH